MLPAQRLQQLRERSVKCVGDPVECADTCRNPARLDLDDRLAVHSGGLSERVDGVPVGSPQTRDFNSERKQIGGGYEHGSTLPQ